MRQETAEAAVANINDNTASLDEADSFVRAASEPSATPNTIIEAAVALARRKLVPQADTILAEGCERFPDSIELKTQFARNAGRLKNFEEESRRWAAIRDSFPRAAHGFVGGCQCARTHGRLDEAEAILESGFAQLGNNGRLLAEHAICAAERKNWAEAIQRWEMVDKSGGLDAIGYTHLGAALIKAGRAEEVEERLNPGLRKFPGHIVIRAKLAEAATIVEDGAKNTIIEDAIALVRQKLVPEADTLLAEGCERFPDSIELRTQFARNAGRLKNFEEESRRWAAIRDSFPRAAHGFVGGCQCARKQGRLDEAEAILESGFAQLGNDGRLLAEHAICAAERKNWAEAIQRWEMLEQSGGLDAIGYTNLGATLIKAGRAKEVEERLNPGLRKFPGDIAIRVQLAEAATMVEDWAKALKLWREISKDEPDSARSINGFGQALWQYQLHVGNDEAQTAEGADGPERLDLEAPVDVGLVNDVDLRALMLRFESLGPNCEFGLVQRRFGAEPLNLLRWTSTAPNVLLNGIRQQFDGLGVFDSTILDVQPAEIMVRDKTYGFHFHTFSKHKEGMDLEDFRLKQSKHFSYLKKVFLNRLREGGKIYVYKSDTGCDLVRIKEIYEELRKFSPVSLLFVDRFNDDNPAGSAQRVYDDLYIGYISKFGRDEDRSWNIAFESWVSICTRVAELVDEKYPSLTT